MICAVRPWKTLDRWVPGGGDLPEFLHETVAIEDVVAPRRESLHLRATLGEWTPITIHFDGSVEARVRDTAFKGAMCAAYPGDIVFSKIDIRNGALTVMPTAIKQAVVTGEYPVHTPDPDLVDARYLSLVLRAPEFLAQLKQLASGHSGRKRITAEQFRSLQIPLPDLAVQRRLVADYERGMAKAAEREAAAAKAERDARLAFEAALGLTPPADLPRRFAQIAHFRDSERWSHEGIRQRVIAGSQDATSAFPYLDLGELADVTYGLQKCPSNRPGRHPRPYLRVANVQRNRLDLRVIKQIDVTPDLMPRFRLEPGDVLLCEGNSTEHVGRAAIWRGEIPDCVHQNHVLRLRVSSQVLPEFLLAIINSSVGQSYFRSCAKQTTNLASINSDEVRRMPIPVPPIPVQQRIVRMLEESTCTVQGGVEAAARVRATAWRNFVTAVFG